AGGHIGVGVGPTLRVFQRVELGDDQAAGETGRPGILRLDRRERSGQQQATLVLQLVQSLQVLGAGRKALVQRTGMILGDDREPHGQGSVACRIRNFTRLCHRSCGSPLEAAATMPTLRTSSTMRWGERYMWTMFVDGIAALLNQLATWMDGSYGLAVIALALAVRLAMLPMTLHAAEQGWLRQRKLAALKPQLERLRERHAKDPAAHAAAMQSLYREHGIASGLGSGMLTALVQAPMSAGIYAAIRQGVASMGSFLWLALLVAVLGMVAMLFNPMLPEQARTLLHWLPVAISFLMVWHVAAGLGLYWLGSGSVTVLQNLMLRRRVRRLSA